PIQISPIAVVTDAVDSEQVGADLIAHGSTLHLLFIDEQSRSLFHSRSSSEGVWSAPELLIEGIDAAWVRGSVHLNAAGNRVYGFVFDGGSQGGPGFTRYFSMPLECSASARKFPPRQCDSCVVKPSQLSHHDDL